MEWTLHDINFAVEPYESPDLPPDAGTLLQQMALQATALVTLMALIVFVAAEVAAKQRRPPEPPASFNRRERRGSDLDPREAPRARSRGGDEQGGADVQVWSEDVDRLQDPSSSGQSQPRTISWSAGPGH